MDTFIKRLKTGKKYLGTYTHMITLRDKPKVKRVVTSDEDGEREKLGIRF